MRSLLFSSLPKHSLISAGFVKSKSTIKKRSKITGLLLVKYLSSSSSSPRKPFLSLHKHNHIPLSIQILSQSQTRTLNTNSTIKMSTPAENKSYSTTTTSSLGNADAFKELGIQNTKINAAEGVNLSEKQKVVVGSILDLFAGRPSLPKLSLWAETAIFEDPITKAEGRKQYAAQWYGLQSAFSQIEQISHRVTNGGNPIEMDLHTRYVVKGLGVEQVIKSKVSIFTNGGDGKGPLAKEDMSILKVVDAWNGELPGEGVFVKAMRNLNSVVVPAFVSVPKNEEEDKKRGN
ncbi:3afa8c08-3605-4411-a53b-9eb1655aa8d8 [Sclerotinia trifoliorum]|uniref:3afa8c08-3605-4411-a53b-9eb1655aa8d8 n=1 Tax=Sclerotinia trifoliorum TaxID=28548 RepID=A0A8H2VS78_9HELO|nr:3afa8c08-3605-4411-a53b-9eb1655aa8d8 [Sclerotinia trifoliorum]